MKFSTSGGTKSRFMKNVMILQSYHNLTLPSWTKKVYPKRLQELLDLFLYKEFSEPKILKFSAGKSEIIEII